jgi:hypothetical protein
VYPQFGHYQRYDSYQNNSPTSSDGSGTAVTARPHPFYQTATVVSAPYVYSPANFTVTTPNGPPIVADYRFDTTNLGDPTQSVPTVNPSLLMNAFQATTFSATSRTASLGPTPAPADLAAQASTPATFAGSSYGDRWPRKGGAATGTTWDPTDPNGAAITAAEYLGWVTSYTSGSTLPSTLPAAITGGASGRSTGASWANFRDATWERYGYSLDVAHYIANRNGGLATNAANNNGKWDPRWDAGKAKVSKTSNISTDNPPTQSTYTPKTDQPFSGYTLGPGYWGKTFFIWPPDPRPAYDWRRLYFLERDGSAFVTGSAAGDNLSDTAVDADNVTTGNQNVNEKLFTNGTGGTLLTNTNNYTVNYVAVLNWIRSGPQTLPPNLRAGRVQFYTSIPTDVDTTTGTTDQKMDKAFWKGYIDFVLGTNPTISADLAGNEPVGWPEGVTPSRTAGNLTGYVTPTSPAPWATTAVTDPRPYMAYTDNPSRPRMHFWFGPLTMMAYIHNNTTRWSGSGSRTLIPGTVHEAQSWQLKAGVAAALDDIKANHPNDLVGMSFFSNADYNSIVVPTGQDWSTLKNSLFYPRSLLSVIDTNPTAEAALYNSSLAQTNPKDIPNAKGSTDPNTGLSMAFNLLAASPSVNSDPTRRGRRGAAKIVIFETDGVPNSTQNYQFNAKGYESYYSTGGSVTATPQQAAWDVVTQIVKPTATTNGNGVDSGHSLPNAPARVYAIGFGDIFSTSAGPTASAFLLQVQKIGNTSSMTDLAMPPNQIITGEYDVRIANLKDCLERIMQSGVQVTLIE